MKIDGKIEAEIDALLARDEAESIIDTLLAMPPAAANSANDSTWENAMHARLQARLAQKMREVLEEAPRDQKGSRSAA